MEQINISTDVLRAEFNRIAETVAKFMGIDVETVIANYKFMPFELVMAQYLSPTSSQYNMSPRKGVDNTGILTTNLLDQNDYFAMTGLAIRIGRAAYASGVYSNWGNYFQFSYPDPNFFTGNGSSASVGSEATSLLPLVNGNTTITVSGDNVLENMNNRNLMENPVATYSSSPVAYPSFGGRSDNGTRGFLPIQQHIILDAGSDNQFQVTVANGFKGNIDGSISTATTDSGTRNILYVAAYGWKIKNLAKGALDCPVKA